MKLIPILAFIILVATISTFIFAIGAYIMFKLREMRGKSGAKKENPNLQVEVVGAEGYNGDADSPHLETNGTNGVNASNISNTLTSILKTDQKFRRYTSEGYIPIGKQDIREDEW